MATAPEMLCAASITYDRAQEVIRTNCPTFGMEWIALNKAGRRILARDTVAQIDSPRRDCAAMDGYAVRSQDLGEHGTRLPLRGDSVAGGAEPPALFPHTAIRVSTGAPMPAGADRVVMRELVTVDGSSVSIPSVSGKVHVRLKASDFASGQTLLRAGTRMDARAMVVASAADIEKVPVWRQPRLRVLANGDELVAPGQAALSPDAIPDSLSEALLLMARQWGAKPLGGARSPDRIESLRDHAQAALEDTDVLVIAGGASHGPRDLVRSALMPLGLRVLFEGVAIKPGKPLWYGMVGKTHVLGLPGNPTAALTTARLFLAPMICALTGAGFDHALQWQERSVLHEVAVGGGHDQFLCASSEGTFDAVSILERQEASSQMMLAQADLLVERRMGASPVRAGDTVQCLRF